MASGQRRATTSDYRRRIRAQRIRTEEQLRALSPARYQARLRAEKALGRMRQGASMTRAIKESDTSREALFRYFRHQLRRDRSGRYQARRLSGDPFVMTVVTTQGAQARVVASIKQRSVVGRHHSAIKQYLATGDAAVLAPFEGEQVAGATLDTDPDRVVELWRLGELDFLEIYRLAA